MLIKIKFWYKKAVHLFHLLKVRFIRGLDAVDRIPSVVRLPLGAFLLAFWFLALYVPFINGMILMIIGARMIGKKTFRRVYIWLLNFFTKKYKNLKSALFHTLKD